MNNLDYAINIFSDIIIKATAKRRDPKKWSRIKSAVKAGSKGGRPGQWSARKAQLAVQRYKKAGGGYKGKKSGKSSLSKWTKQKWGTKSVSYTHLTLPTPPYV